MFMYINIFDSNKNKLIKKGSNDQLCIKIDLYALLEISQQSISFIVYLA